MISSAKTSFIAAFADELRRAREYSGMDLGEVARITRLSMVYLDALEAGKWETIPQPYLRGFLSQYAKAIGMNVDKVLQSYDQLLAAPDVDESATLDLTSPLLPQPEHIGVTRAKIRTGWFAALSQNRRVAYLALVCAVVIFGVGLSVSRRTQRPRVVPAPFARSITEYSEATRGPVTYLNLATPNTEANSSARNLRRLVLVANDTGSVIFGRMGSGKKILRYLPYDSLVIDYDSLSYVKVATGSSANLTRSSGESIRADTLIGDTAEYSFAVPDSVKWTRLNDSADGP